MTAPRPASILTATARTGAKPRPTSTAAPRRAALELEVVGVEDADVVALVVDLATVEDDEAVDEPELELEAADVDEAELEVEEPEGADTVASAANRTDEVYVTQLDDAGVCSNI